MATADTVSIRAAASGSNQLTQFPPCRVCGGLASGFHYGVTTCEACKVFFMRTTNYKQKHVCPRIKRCHIQSNTRTCAYCRLQRCLSIGMSKNASIIGRYTLQRRTLNHEELINHKNMVHLHHKLITSPDHVYQRMARCLSNASNVYDIFDDVPRDLAVLHQKQMDYFEWHSACSMTVGKLNVLSESEYEDFYQVTGLDIDNRRAIHKVCIDFLEDGIEMQIKFSKTIPGFKRLSLTDQTNIIRASAGDFSRLCAARCFNDDVGVGSIHFGNSFTIEDISCVVDESYMRQSFDLSGKLMKLRLLDEEIAVLKAICITFTDRVDLEDKAAVDNIQWTLIGCLCWLLKRNHSKPEYMFYKIWDCVLLIRELTEKYKVHAKEMLRRLPDGTDAPLLREFSGS